MGKVLICGAVLLLIPLNKYFININVTFAFVFSLCWIILWAFIIKSKSKKTNVFMYVLGIILALVMFCFTELNAYWNSQSDRIEGYKYSLDGNTVLSRKEALKDYDLAMSYLNRIHPLAYKGLPEEVSKKASSVRDKIKGSDGISVRDLCIDIESVFSMLNDGHTHVDENISEKHYMKYIYQHNTDGYTVGGINGIPLEDLLSMCRDRLSFETESYAMRLLRSHISTLEGLDYLGVDVTGEITYNYVSEDGRTDEVTVTAKDFLPMDEYLDYISANCGYDPSSEEEEHEFVYYEIDEEDDLAVLTIDSCDYTSYYKKTLQAMFDEVYAKGVDTIVVDLRNNGGGSSYVAERFISYLDVPSYRSWRSEVRYNFLMIPFKASVDKNHIKGEGFSGDVYVLTSVSSYSAAMDFAMLIQDNGLGTIVGEACGNLPHSYGDVVCFSLPNSGLYMQVSRKAWHRVDESKEYLPIIPDIECDPKEALEAVKEHIGQAD